MQPPRLLIVCHTVYYYNSLAISKKILEMKPTYF